jgi:lipopolysaccharide export system protein LptA
MKPLARESAGAAAIVTLLLSAALLTQGAAAQAPPPAAPPAATPSLGGGSNSPIDVTSENLEVIQPQRLRIYSGNVEVLQDDMRLRSPKIFIYTKDKPTAGTAKSASAASTDMGNSIDHMDAEGPVYFVTPTENARGDHGHYDGASNTITLDGNVVLAQGKSVGKGDHLIINRTTGIYNLTSDNPKATTGRIRTILYPQQQTPAAPAKPAGKPS